MTTTQLHTHTLLLMLSLSQVFWCSTTHIFQSLRQLYYFYLTSEIALTIFSVPLITLIYN